MVTSRPFVVLGRRSRPPSPRCFSAPLPRGFLVSGRISPNVPGTPAEKRLSNIKWIIHMG